MTDDDRLVEPIELPEDKSEDLSIRPRLLRDYVGQKSVHEQLEVFIAAAKNRREALEQVWLSGPTGLGTTTLANIIATKWAYRCDKLQVQYWKKRVT